MTSKEFDAVLVRLCPGIAMGLNAISRVRVCQTVAAEMFRTTQAENEDTAALRHQLNSLYSKGVFDFTSWDDER